MVFPRAALGRDHRAAPAPATCSSRSGTACRSSARLEPRPPGRLPAPRARRDVEHGARRHARRRSAQPFESQVAPPLYRRTPIATLSESSKQRAGRRARASAADRVTVVHPGIDPRFSPGRRAQPPTRVIVAVGRLAPVKRYDVLVRVPPHHARRPRPDLRARSSSATATSGPSSRPSIRRARRRRLGHAARPTSPTRSWSTSTAGRGSSPPPRPPRAGA